MTMIEVTVVILALHAVIISVLFWMLWRKQYDDMRSLAAHGLPAQEVDENFQTLIECIRSAEARENASRAEHSRWMKSALDTIPILMNLQKQVRELETANGIDRT